jgi:hypothetical protein
MAFPTVTTNGRLRLLLGWYQLTKKEQAEFDYLSEDQRTGRDFVRYRRWVYDLGDFVRFQVHVPGWDSHNGGDSYFSAVYVRFVDDDHVVMATATW